MHSVYQRKVHEFIWGSDITRAIMWALGHIV